MRYLLGAPTARGPAALAVSDFDGVDASHRRLAGRAAELAATHGVPAVAAILWPGNGTESALLTALDERLQLLAGLRLLDDVAVLPFGGDVGMDVIGLLDMLDAWYDVRALVALTASSAPPFWEALHAAVSRRGYPLVGMEPGDVATRADIALLIETGEVAQFAALLGHCFAVRGQVIAGDRRGRLLGFPTANLRPDPRKALPATGVYAVRVRLPGEPSAAHAGVANIGVRPTFGAGDAPIIEVHLLDVTLDLYGLHIAVELVDRIRAEQRFPSVEALKAQIDADARRARALLATAPVVPTGERDAPR